MANAAGSNFTTRPQGTRYSGILTRRQHKKAMVRSGRGTGQPTVPGVNFISGCPFCDWVMGADNRTRRPVEVAASESTKVQCKNGHVWRVS